MTGTSVFATDDRAHRVLVVYNENEPESKLLATYYAEKRGIPPDRLCGLRVRNVEVITRREFTRQIHDPLRQFLTDHNLLFQLAGATFDNKLDYLVLIYGIPLRIEEDPTVKETPPPPITGAGPAQRSVGGQRVDHLAVAASPADWLAAKSVFRHCLPAF